MQFYRFEGMITDADFNPDEETREVFRERKRKLNSRIHNFNRELNNKEYYFIAEIDDRFIACGAFVSDQDDLLNKFGNFFKATGFKIDMGEYEEITFQNFTDMLNSSNRGGFIYDSDDDVLERLGIPNLNRRYYGDIEFDENIIDYESRENIDDMINNYLLKDSFMPEIERIYNSPKDLKTFGIPVHYTFMIDDHDRRRELYRALLSALYYNKRLQNRRYCYLDITSSGRFNASVLDEIYKRNMGGAIVIRYTASESEDNQYASSDRETISKISEIISRYKNKVLTIICLKKSAKRSLDRFKEYMSGVCFVDLQEDLVDAEKAVKYLKMMAKRDHLRVNKALLNKVEAESHYYADDLNGIYNSWMCMEIKKLYPGYSEIKLPEVKTKEKERGSAYQELQDMIGLEGIKEKVDQIISYYKAKKLFESKGMPMENANLHLMFTGNPGCAKTSVAKLLAQIFKENGILSKGELITANRDSLVGQYVGWSAVQTREIMKRAKGNVLLIDEAYSLSMEHSNSFGTEVINELTSLLDMEEYRSDIVVVFCGYKDLMEDFLRVNPGLSSRIGFQIDFPDYSVDQLCDIADYMAKSQQLNLTDGAKSKIRTICESAVSCKDNGQGRMIRNILQQSRMAQAERLLKKPSDLITREEIATLKEEDIVSPSNLRTEEKKTIGFCA